MCLTIQKQTKNLKKTSTLFAHFAESNWDRLEWIAFTHTDLMINGMLKNGYKE